MHIITRNVNTAFRDLVGGIHSGRIPTEVMSSRYGEVAVVEEPVTVTFTHPKERVLFNVARDANPFFHLYEALWMLAGRNDVAPLVYYNRRMAEFSDDGATLNGAYGYRWRHAWIPDVAQKGKQVDDGDQLAFLIDHLRRKPESRRAVLQMWSAERDLQEIDRSKDVCCNLSVCFLVESGPCRFCKGRGYREVCDVCKGLSHERPSYLNMTVFNRSNDLVWGMLGANAVHFSFLQEYVAAHLGVEVGRYHQITSNLHVYTKAWHPEKWLADGAPDYYVDASVIRTEDWGVDFGKTVPSVADPAAFDVQVSRFVRLNDGSCHHDDTLPEGRRMWSEPFLGDVARPMFHAFHFYRKGRDASDLGLMKVALEWCNYIKAPDWRVAARGWIERRVRKVEMT